MKICPFFFSVSLSISHYVRFLLSSSRLTSILSHTHIDNYPSFASSPTKLDFGIVIVQGVNPVLIFCYGSHNHPRQNQLSIASLRVV